MNNLKAWTLAGTLLISLPLWSQDGMSTAPIFDPSNTAFGSSALILNQGTNSPKMKTGAGSGIKPGKGTRTGKGTGAGTGAGTGSAPAATNPMGEWRGI